MKAVSVARWYDRRARSWVVYKVDAAGCQVGDAAFSGTRAGADAFESDMRREIEQESKIMSPRRTAPEIIGFHLGWDIRDVTEGRYQRYTAPGVYVCGSAYFCSPTASQKPPHLGLKGEPPTEWEKVGTYYGRDVFRAKESE